MATASLQGTAAIVVTTIAGVARSLTGVANVVVAATPPKPYVLNVLGEIDRTRVKSFDFNT